MIRSATLDAAEVMRKKGQIGCLAEGAHADLIMLRSISLDYLSVLDGQGEQNNTIMKDGRFLRLYKAGRLGVQSRHLVDRIWHGLAGTDPTKSRTSADKTRKT